MHIDVDVDIDLEYRHNVDVDIDTDICIYIYIDWRFNSSKWIFYMTHPSDIGISDITSE